MPPSTIEIRPDLAAAPFAEPFRNQGVVQIADFLSAPSAQVVEGVLNALPYVIVAPDERGDTLVLDNRVMQQFGEAQVRNFLQDTIRRASTGFSFIHRSYPLQDEYARSPQNPAAAITEFLQSRPFLDFGAEIIGKPVDGVRVQASHYRKGDFLTLHDDSHTRDDRLAAFTLGFTKGWRPDWGGQLLFHDAAGDVTQGFAPRFNVLTVFAVPKAHSVAPVAAYATQPRYSLTGWFIREPKG